MKVGFMRYRRNQASQRSIDLTNWMGNLESKMRNVPITRLAIPGSHDSMTFGIKRNSKIAPDTDWVKVAKFLRPFIRLIMYGWTVTQKKNTTQQLNLGIRYLDFRVATMKNDDDLYFVHGMYGKNVSSALLDIYYFLNKHPREVVILDFQHFYDFEESDHEHLINLLVDVFNDSLCPQPSDVSTITLDTMFNKRQQVIVVYRNRMCSSSNVLWRSNLLPTFWPNTMSVSHLLEYIEGIIADRPASSGYVTQCILTPQKATVFKHPFSGVKGACAKPVSQTIIQWMIRDSPPLNIAIADFIEMKNAVFPRSVISLNYSRQV